VTAMRHENEKIDTTNRGQVVEEDLRIGTCFVSIKNLTWRERTIHHVI
jgi:hypothetical protein